MSGTWQERLSEVMDERGLSGGELARRTGFTPQYINSLRGRDRGARIPHETAHKLAAALGVSLDWLTRGEGPREPPRVSDVYPTAGHGAADPYSSRAEVIALLGSAVEPEVIAALRAVTPQGGADPGRDFWIDYARDLARSLRKIQRDPVLGRRARATKG